ncbi:type 12 methyltransferase [Mycobacterium bohemicum DSM 44277]|uniref:Methyltransferase type 12 n=2 Tax=Mycobacterium bohemicum TaxID=56425 RepID=A0A1X1REG5_MYCBE|nr:class I SAM-dependent methyltransferase [Mycobacterium bohemicum]MCV6968805.1 class I SAM-dependent methyltransferase [Mycobacterium bohemicum]ORV03885.1 methyltransferase type 12 [Mycobacterium bohemicum]CPR09771.1 type 12 methyltransferase [Mycobacterium bohemicum DSM 44277]
MDNPPLRSSSPAQLREAMARRLHRRSVASGQLTLPAVPAMIDEYVSMCQNIFAGLGIKFNAAELAHLRKVLEGELTDAYAASPRSNIVISYDCPVGMVLNYNVRAEWQTLAESYGTWAGTRQPPLFGIEPDARVWALAWEASDPRACRVLDIGAGTGRNALALARRGHPVDAVEMTPHFAETIRAEAEREGLDVRVIERDVFSATDDLRWDYQLIVLSEVVSDFRTTRQLRSMFELAARCLAPGGRLVFNAFLARQGYTPDEAARELGQQVYSTIFTSYEVTNATALLPLNLIADDSVYEFESTYLPAGAWPPTHWYAEWVSGLDIFDVDREASPVEMRWLVYEKPGWDGRAQG